MVIEYGKSKRGASLVVVEEELDDVFFPFTPGILYRICEITQDEVCLKDDRGRLHIFRLCDPRFRAATEEELGLMRVHDTGSEHLD